MKQDSKTEADERSQKASENTYADLLADDRAIEGEEGEREGLTTTPGFFEKSAAADTSREARLGEEPLSSAEDAELVEKPEEFRL